MKKGMSWAWVLALFLGPFARTEAAPRCYPNRRFAVANGEVTDKLTNLVWQQQASTSGMSWAAAKTYCPSGFRLPTVQELTSLVDLTVASPGPTIDQTAFPGTPAQRFWTSSPFVGSSGQAWYVYFNDGSSRPFSVSDRYWVRCVR